MGFEYRIFQLFLSGKAMKSEIIPIHRGIHAIRKNMNGVFPESTLDSRLSKNLHAESFPDASNEVTYVAAAIPPKRSAYGT